MAQMIIINKWVENDSEEADFASKNNLFYKYFPFYVSTDAIKWYLYLNLKESFKKNKIQFCVVRKYGHNLMGDACSYWVIK